MGRAPQGNIIQRTFQALEEYGPMTRAEICRVMGVKNIGNALSYLMHAKKYGNQHGETRPRQVYIQSWCYDDDFGRSYPRAVYAVGDLRDKPKPRPQRKSVSMAKYRDKMRAKRTSSIFKLGVELAKQNANQFLTDAKRNAAHPRRA